MKQLVLDLNRKEFIINLCYRINMKKKSKTSLLIENNALEEFIVSINSFAQRYYYLEHSRRIRKGLERRKNGR
jgi:hypothetical protein